MSDLWLWRVYYTDASFFDEDERGRLHGWGEVDQDRVLAVELRPQAEGLPTHILMLEPGARPIFFRRRVQADIGHGFEARPDCTIHCLGWQVTTPGGNNVESYTFYLSNGITVVSNDRNPSVLSDVSNRQVMG